MTEVRSSEIGKMGGEEREKHLTELKKNLMKIRGGLASGGVPENVGKTREIKRTIARILTKKREEALKRNDLS
jgi:large subunit ribosomal protein L29